MLRKNKGMTLITIVITIIVIIILSGSTLSMVLDVNLIDKSKDAVNQYNNNQNEDSNILGGLMDGLIGKSEYEEPEEDEPEYEDPEDDEIDDGGNGDGGNGDGGNGDGGNGDGGNGDGGNDDGGNDDGGNDDGGTEIDRSDISLSDYILYTPTGTPYVTKYMDQEGVTAIQKKYSGCTVDQAVYLQDTEWKVFDIKEDGTIEIISKYSLYIGSEKNNTTGVAFKGATGYNNAVEILNHLCHNLYGTGNSAVGARNISLYDIQQKMNTSVWDWKSHSNSYVDTGKYGGTKTYQSAAAYYPVRWVQEVTGKVNGISTGGTLEPSESASKLIAWDETNSNEKLGLTYLQGNNITITQMYWYNRPGWTQNNFIDSKYYNLLITDKDGYNYSNWIASRTIDAGADRAFFGMRVVIDANIGSEAWLHSIGAQYESAHGIRPIVTLDAKTLLELDSEKSSDTIKYWKIVEAN